MIVPAAEVSFPQAAHSQLARTASGPVMAARGRRSRRASAWRRDAGHRRLHRERRLEGGAGHGAVIFPAAGHDGTLHERRPPHLVKGKGISGIFFPRAACKILIDSERRKNTQASNGVRHGNWRDRDRRISVGSDSVFSTTSGAFGDFREVRPPAGLAQLAGRRTSCQTGPNLVVTAHADMAAASSLRRH